MRRPFRVQGEEVEAVLTEQEAAALRDLRAHVGGLVASDDEEHRAIRERLFPRAYSDPTEEDAEREWQRLMHRELLEGKQHALDVVVATLERAETSRGRLRARLGADEAHAWLTALTDVRLSLGTMLGITEDVDLSAVDPGDPEAPAYHLYGWLTWLQSELVETLMG